MSFAQRANTLIGWLGPDRSRAERVALFAAAAAVGPSFEPGLQPRRTIDQAIATGVVSATTLTLVTAAQSTLEGIGEKIVRGDGELRTVGTRLLFSVAGNMAAAGIAEGIARALPPREDEQLRRGALRVAANRVSRVALLGAGLSFLFGASDLLEQSDPRTRWMRRIPIALPMGVATSAWQIHRAHAHAAKFGDDTISQVSTRNSVLIASGVGAGVLGLQIGEATIAHGVAHVVRRIAPTYDSVSNPVGHIVSLGLLGGALVAGYEYAVRRVEDGGTSIEPAYDIPPNLPSVSGSPQSCVSFESLSREGRRFVNMALTRDDIESVMGTPAVADPVRVFVGLGSAEEVEDRVDLLMDELIRVGAFERKVLMFASPTGSGYINYVAAEALEYLTLGDCAIATMQYSMLPSSMSLTRTGLAVEQNRSVMHAVTGYLRGMKDSERPRFVLFGESLGAQTTQDVWRHRTMEALDRDFVHSGLFLGTPSATEFAKAWRLNPERMDPAGAIAEVDNYDEILAMSEQERERIRIVLLTHHDDPIPKFGTNLILRQPGWLGPVDTRPQGVPKSSHWRPGTTFVLTGLDMVNAMEVQPGVFGRRGHDYREDIARFVSFTYGLPCSTVQLASIEQALRDRELKWAEKRVVAEQIARARESVLRELKSWGVSTGADGQADKILREAMESRQP